jgi:putative transposase
MTLFQNRYRIESTRLPGWDYSDDGKYFITICTKDREFYFGEIAGGKMHYSDIGKIANQYWVEIPDHFPFITLDEFVVMPNHIHGILIINKNNTVVDTLHCSVSTTNRRSRTPIGETPNPIMSAISPKRGSLGSVIRSFKSACTTTINEQYPESRFRWLPRFHDSIIRDDQSLQRIRQYIKNNPSNWKDDEYR